MSDDLKVRLNEVEWSGKDRGRSCGDGTTCWYRNPDGPEAAQRIATLEAQVAELVAGLKTATEHIEHMAAWITRYPAGYSFESLGEDMPDIRALLAKHKEGR